jgi:hypothetical protein
MEGSVKKSLFLFLLLLVVADRASADGLASICGFSPASVLSNGKFQAAVGHCAGYQSLGTVIAIEGPAGLEILWGAGPVDTDRAFYLNNKGEVVFSYEATGDRATLVAAYTGPGVQEIPDARICSCCCGSSNLPGTTITTYSAALGMDPGPVFQDPREPNGLDAPITDGLFPNILATGITNNGIVEGVEQYGYDFHPLVSIPATWDFMPAPEPSTWLYALAAVLVILVTKWKTLRRQFQ